MSQNDELVAFVSSLGGGDGLRVEESLGEGYYRLRVSEAERRQAKHDIRCVEDAVIELLRNARDAGASRVFVASSKEGSVRTVVVADDGDGIPSHMRERVFDARVTSKLDTMSMDRWGVHGRGMALFSIRQNAVLSYVADSAPHKGAAIVVAFDTDSIQERADQSAWPTVRRSGGEWEVRGPRNIVRACVEFALESRDKCLVYYGLPSEIVATMRRRMVSRVPFDQRRQVGIAERASTCQNARELCEVAKGMGMDMSERTAHRIIRGQIAPLRNVCAKVLEGSEGAGEVRAGAEARAISLSEEDREELEAALTREVAKVLGRYYAAPCGTPRLRMGRGSLSVTFELEEDE